MGRPRTMEKREENVVWKAIDHTDAENRRYTLYRIALGRRLVDNAFIFKFLLLTDVEDSIDVDVDRAEKDEAADTADVEDDKEGEPDNEDIEEQIDSEKDEHDDDRSFDHHQEDEEVKVSSSDEEEKASDEEKKVQHKQRQDSSETEIKTSVDKEKVSSFTQDRERYMFSSEVVQGYNPAFCQVAMTIH